ncbi:MAG: DUF3037 domain-containing protein [Terriglobales bacterium]
MANELKQLEFMLIRYVPDAVKDEFVNIGVLLLNGDSADLRFTRDWRRVRCLDPAADIEMLEALEADLRQQLTSGVLDRATLLKKLQDYLSNGLQLTAAKGCLAEDPAQELQSLAQMYLEHRRAGARETSGRQAIVAQMKSAFEHAGVWALMKKKIAAAQYTHKGDPLKIDCGYRPNGVIKMFHAVSLDSDVDAAKVLAFTYPDIRDGIARVENAKSELTAIIEPDLDRSDEAILFALATLERNAIAVATTSELPSIAERARLELRI